ncbi:MAG: hypothetical protein AMXMBFR64_08480 [Myxococcales bacterium]
MAEPTTGVQARSKRGAMGAAWWSRRFTEALAALDPGGRLRRGRAAARRGEVESVEVTSGRVRAVVKDTEPREVTIGFSVFDEGTWTEVGEALRARPLLAARLLAGEVPEEIEGVFAAAEAALFPARMSDLKLACSCPDWDMPCAHVAAVFALVAERLDADPFLLLALRGGTRERLAGLLVEGAGEPVAESPPADPDTPLGGTLVDPVAFWAVGPLPLIPVAAQPPTELPLLRALGPLPFWSAAPLLELLARSPGEPAAPSDETRPCLLGVGPIS